MADIRTCNLCIGRSVRGSMHYCQHCMRFICTREKCVETHEAECGDDLAAPIPDTRRRPPAMVVAFRDKNIFIPMTQK